MKNAFKQAFLVLLTILFVSATPVTAYAQPTTQNVMNLVEATTLIADDDQMPAAPVCVSFENALSLDDVKRVEQAGGKVVQINGPEVNAFQSRLEDLLGQKAPYAISQVIIVSPDVTADTYNIALFSDGCLQTVLHLPVIVIDTIMGTEKRVPAGEKVD